MSFGVATVLFLILYKRKVRLRFLGLASEVIKLGFKLRHLIAEPTHVTSSPYSILTRIPTGNENYPSIISGTLTQSFQSRSSQPGAILDARGHLSMSGGIFGYHTGQEMPLVSSGRRPGRQLNTLQCTGQTPSPQRNNYPAQSVHSAEV